MIFQNSATLAGLDYADEHFCSFAYPNTWLFDIKEIALFVSWCVLKRLGVVLLGKFFDPYGCFHLLRLRWEAVR